jgi:hypothetical protein
MFEAKFLFWMQAIKESIAEGEDPRLSSFSSPSLQVRDFLGLRSIYQIWF